jgi:hypothetical protein
MDGGETIMPPLPPPPPNRKAIDREALGKRVRDVWIEYCKKIGDTKPSHIAPWEALSEADKEADRLIGEELYQLGYDSAVKERSYIADIAFNPLPRDHRPRGLTGEERLWW